MPLEMVFSRIIDELNSSHTDILSNTQTVWINIQNARIEFERQILPQCF